MDKSFTMSLSILRVLLYGDERLTEIDPISKEIGDTAKVLILPLALGKNLAAIDDTESFFHVELFDDHSELWLEFEWKESNARHKRIQASAAERRLIHDRTNERIQAIIEKLRPFGLDKQPGFAERLARDILNVSNKENIKEVLKIFNLVELIESYDTKTKTE